MPADGFFARFGRRRRSAGLGIYLEESRRIDTVPRCRPSDSVASSTAPLSAYAMSVPQLDQNAIRDATRRWARSNLTD